MFNRYALLVVLLITSSAANAVTIPAEYFAYFKAQFRYVMISQTPCKKQDFKGNWKKAQTVEFDNDTTAKFCWRDAKPNTAIQMCMVGDSGKIPKESNYCVFVEKDEFIDTDTLPKKAKKF